MVKILIDKEKCIRCGLCAGICPDAFELKEDGLEIIHKDEYKDSEKTDMKLNDELEMAETSCPVKAIVIEQDPIK